MGKLRVCLFLCVAALVLSFAPGAWGQDTPGGANADIVKMIQAGLPESTVANKIREGAGRWDTSVDALIALKHVGATEAELGVLTGVLSASPVSQFAVPQPPSDPFAQTSLDEVTDIISKGIAEFQNSDIALGNPIYGGETAGTATPQISYFPNLSANVSTCNADYTLSMYGMIGIMAVANPKQLKLHFSFGNLSNISESILPLPSKAPEQNPIYIVSLAFTGTDQSAFFFFNSDVNAHRVAAAMRRANKLCEGKLMDRSELVSLSHDLSQLGAATNELSEEIFRYANDHTQTSVIGIQPQNSHALFDGLMSAISQGTSQMADAATANNAVVQARLAQQQAQIAASQQDNHNVKTAKPHSNANPQNLTRPGSGNQGSASNTIEDPKKVGNAGQSSAGDMQDFFGRFFGNEGAAASTSTNSNGQVAPANCVAVNVEGPCVPLAQYQQTQVQQQTSGQGICPASGFVPGVMLRQTSDVAVGVPCKPGTPYGPLIATTASGGYSGVTPPDPATAGPSGSGSGGSNTGGLYDPDLNNCVVYFYKNDPITGDHLILQNNCSVRAQVYFYASSQVNGGAAIDPGATDNTYAGHDKILAAGALSIYACPVNDIPRQADGTLAYNGLNHRFLCSQK